MAKGSHSKLWGTRFTYTGKPFDNESGIGLHYYGARYYDAELGRFMAIDPAAAKYPSLSPYAYCANNPLKYIDPDGRKIYYRGDDFERAKADFEAARAGSEDFNSAASRFDGDDGPDLYVTTGAKMYDRKAGSFSGDAVVLGDVNLVFQGDDLSEATMTIDYVDVDAVGADGRVVLGHELGHVDGAARTGADGYNARRLESTGNKAGGVDLDRAEQDAIDFEHLIADQLGAQNLDEARNGLSESRELRETNR